MLSTYLIREDVDKSCSFLQEEQPFFLRILEVRKVVTKKNKKTGRAFIFLVSYTVRIGQSSSLLGLGE